jgi:hypothetical protein
LVAKRRCFIVQWNQSLDYAIYVDSEPTQQVAEWLKLIPAAFKAQSESDDYEVETLVPSENCLLYDWSIQELPADLRINQVPKPGVVFAVRRGARLEYGEKSASDPDAGGASSTVHTTEGTSTDGGGAHESQEAEEPEADSGDEYTLLYLLKRELSRTDSSYADPYGRRLRSFLDSPEASYEPLPVTRYDAFISYSGVDQALAREIATDLEGASMRTFMASRDLAAGTLWTDEVREALLASRSLLIVLTPNAVARPWVMLEVGASWALGKPLVPAIAFVDPKDLPEVISAYQGRRIETIEGRQALVTEVVRLSQTND